MQSATLHEAIERVLREAGTAASVEAIARALADRGLYSLSRSRGTIPPAMVEHRVRAHPELFDVADGRVRLAGGLRQRP